MWPFNKVNVNLIGNFKLEYSLSIENKHTGFITGEAVVKAKDRESAKQMLLKEIHEKLKVVIE